jgi:hypothetical protein
VRRPENRYKAKRPIEGWTASKNMARLNLSVPWEMIDALNEQYLQSEHNSFSHYIRDLIRIGMEKR